VGERKGEIDEDDKVVYFVWLDGNGMREGGGLFPSYSIKSEMERKSCDRKFIFDSILIYMAPPLTFFAILLFVVNKTHEERVISIPFSLLPPFPPTDHRIFLLLLLLLLLLLFLLISVFC